MIKRDPNNLVYDRHCKLPLMEWITRLAFFLLLFFVCFLLRDWLSLDGTYFHFFHYLYCLGSLCFVLVYVFEKME